MAKANKTKNTASATKDLFNLNNVKSGAKTLFKKQSARSVILLLILAFEMEYFVFRGHHTTSYLFLRKQLKFTMIEFIRMITILGIFGLIGQYIVLPFMSKRLRWRDSYIILIGDFISEGFFHQ